MRREPRAAGRLKFSFMGLKSFLKTVAAVNRKGEGFEADEQAPVRCFKKMDFRRLYAAKDFPQAGA